MTSFARGKPTSEVEVLHVSPRGLRLLVRDREYFMPVESFPWFGDGRLREVHNVELHHGHRLRWPDLDVDLEVEALVAPERYSFVYR